MLVDFRELKFTLSMHLPGEWPMQGGPEVHLVCVYGTTHDDGRNRRCTLRRRGLGRLRLLFRKKTWQLEADWDVALTGKTRDTEERLMRIGRGLRWHCSFTLPTAFAVVIAVNACDGWLVGATRGG